MRAAHLWKPSKFVDSPRGIAPTSDRSELSPGSRIVAGRMGALYEEAIKRHARGRLLDLGCGKVPLYLAYRELVSETCCVDWPSGLHGAMHLDHERDLNVAIDLPDGSFETVILSDVLEHIAEPRRLLRQVHDVLTPGGHVLIGVPFMYWLHEEPHDYFRYTRHALHAMVAGSGLRMVGVRESGGAPEVLADIVGKLLHARPVLQGIVLATLEHLLKTRTSTRMSEATKSKFPLGYVAVATRPN